MHIAFFTNMYHPMVSGVVRSVDSFRKAFSKMGHNVFVFAQHAENYEDKEPFIFRYPSINFTWPADFPATIPVSPFIDQLLPRIKPDVIHAHHPILLGGAAAKKAADLNLPLIFTFHTNYNEYSQYIPLPQESIQELIKELIDNWLGDFMAKCHYIVIPSKSMRLELENKFGLQDSIQVVPTGIDLEPYHKADGKAMRKRLGWGSDLVLVSVGRLGPEKNWPLVFEAAAQAMREIPRLRLALAGNGPERERLETLSFQLGIRGQVEFLGELPFTQIPSFLSAGDAFIFASTAETQGLVTMEAMAAGLPIVAVDGTGTRDVVQSGVQGFLTEKDPGSLGKAVVRLFASSDGLAKMREAVLIKARSFDIYTHAMEMLEVYERAIEKQKAGETVQVRRKRSIFSRST